MAQVARLEARLTGNDVEFNNALDRAEKRAATFTGRVESGFQGLFKRTPGRRAERAIGGLLGDLATGNASIGIAQFAGRLTGLGLAAGVGIGAAVELFTHLHSSVVEVTKARDDLDKQMSKPIGLTSIEGLGKALDNLREKQGTFTHGLTNYLSDIFQKPLVEGAGTGIFDLGKSQIEEERDNQDALDKRHAAEKLRGQTELVRANVLAGITDPRRKALAEARFKFDDRERELQSNPDKGTAKRIEALNVERKATEDNYKLNKEGSNLKLETEEKIAKLIHEGLKPEDQKKVRIGLDLDNIDKEISNETDPGKLRSLKLEKLQKENELIAFRPTQASGGPEWGSLAARDAETNDPNQWGSLAWSAAQRENQPTAAQGQNQEVVKALNGIDAKIEKYWGAAPSK